MMSKKYSGFKLIRNHSERFSSKIRISVCSNIVRSETLCVNLLLHHREFYSKLLSWFSSYHFVYIGIELAPISPSHSFNFFPFCFVFLRCLFLSAENMSFPRKTFVFFFSFSLSPFFFKTLRNYGSFEVHFSSRCLIQVLHNTSFLLLGKPNIFFLRIDGNCL